MTLSDAGLRLIKEFEGLRTEAYRCPAGVWTIGFGTTRGVKPGQVITEDEAEAMLRADVERFAQGVSERIQVPVTQGMYDSLVSFSYNVGLAAFSKSTLLRLLNQSKYDLAASEFSRWTRGGGRILPGLVKRRAAERALFESSDVTPNTPDTDG
jgi:lysozyme